MKLKILILSLLLPFSLFGATNLFNDVRVNNTLTVFDGPFIVTNNINSLPRRLYSNGQSDPQYSVDWQTRTLRATGADSVYWQTMQLVTGSGVNDVAVDWANHFLKTSSGVNSVAWESFVLSGSSGQSVRWSDRTLESTGATGRTLDWQNRYFGADNGAGWTSSNSFTVAGNTTLGDAASDTVIFNASTAAIPNGLNIGSGTVILTNQQVLLPDSVVAAPSLSFINSPNSGYRRSVAGEIFFVSHGTNVFGYAQNLIGIASNSGVRFAESADPFGPASSQFVNAGPGIIEMRAGASKPQEFRIFNAFTTVNNNEYGTIGWANNTFRIGTVENGAGLDRPMTFNVNSAGEVARFETNGFFSVSSNMSSRAQGVVVGPTATTNSLLQSFTGTYAGAPAVVTFGIAFAAAPAVVVTTTETGGTALGNDTAWVTNVTTTGCTVGYRTSGGVDSGATITFNGLAFGRQ